ncbi:MAG: hypothetical protein N3G80_00425 [Candidatus Micrarchaeota archaeon]|nr:hypothetical protein [Candidatus Micrarchaeota archaeon]
MAEDIFPTFSELSKQARDVERRLLQLPPATISESIDLQEPTIFPPEFEQYTISYLLAEAQKIERRLKIGAIQQSVSPPAPSEKEKIVQELASFAKQEFPQAQPPEALSAKQQEEPAETAIQEPPSEALQPPAAEKAEEVQAEAQQPTSASQPATPPKPQKQYSFVSSSKISPRLRAIIEEKIRKEEEKEAEIEKQAEPSQAAPPKAEKPQEPPEEGLQDAEGAMEEPSIQPIPKQPQQPEKSNKQEALQKEEAPPQEAEPPQPRPSYAPPISSSLLIKPIFPDQKAQADSSEPQNRIEKISKIIEELSSDKYKAKAIPQEGQAQKPSISKPPSAKQKEKKSKPPAFATQEDSISELIQDIKRASLNIEKQPVKAKLQPKQKAEKEPAAAPQLSQSKAKERKIPKQSPAPSSYPPKKQLKQPIVPPQQQETFKPTSPSPAPSALRKPRVLPGGIVTEATRTYIPPARPAQQKREIQPSVAPLKRELIRRPAAPASQKQEEESETKQPAQQTKYPREISAEAQLPAEEDDLEIPRPPPEDQEPSAESYQAAKEDFRQRMESQAIKEKTKEEYEAMLESYAKENMIWLYEIYKMGGIPREDFLQKVKEKLEQEKATQSQAESASPFNPAFANLNKEIDKRYKK